MEIYSVDSTEARENKKKQVAKYCHQSSPDPVLHPTPVLVPHVLSGI